MEDLAEQIKKGEMIFIAGHSGSGKSTIANALTGLVEPEAGTATLTGTDLAAGDFVRWAKQTIDVLDQLRGVHGLDPALRDRADLVLSFGAMVWPHMLARVMLAEQLYRAAALLANHPYHRA